MSGVGRVRENAYGTVAACLDFFFFFFFFPSSRVMGGWVGLGWGWGNNTLFYGMVSEREVR